MREIPLHFWAIIAAAIAKIALGALWYSPALFIKPWRRMTGITQEQMREGLGRALVVDIVSSLLMAFVLAYAIGYTGATAVSQGLAVGFLIWLGFVAVATIHNVTYERRPFQLFLLHNGYHLISLLIMSAILAVWR